MNHSGIQYGVTRDSRIQSVFYVDRNHRVLPSTPMLSASYSTKDLRVQRLKADQSIKPMKDSFSSKFGDPVHLSSSLSLCFFIYKMGAYHLLYETINICQVCIGLQRPDIQMAFLIFASGGHIMSVLHKEREIEAR